MRVLLAVALLALGAQASEYGVNPIRRVVNLLQKMAEEIEAEGKKDKEMHEKFMCYCEGNNKDLADQISGGDAAQAQNKAEMEAKAARAKLMDEDSDSSSDSEGPRKISKRKKKEMSRMSIATLKASVKRPDVIESWDTSSHDAKLLVYLKAYRNTVPVPKHWSAKRRYMANKRGYEKPPYKLPEFIEQTGIAKIRQAVMEKQAQQEKKEQKKAVVHEKKQKEKDVRRVVVEAKLAEEEKNETGTLG